MVGGNRVTILENGVEMLPAMLAAIRAAEKSVHMEAYIFWSDSVGRQFRDALAETARRGVEVRVLLDGVGSPKRLETADVQAMRSGGCKVELFRPVRPWMLDVINRPLEKTAFTSGSQDPFERNATFQQIQKEYLLK